MISSTVCCVCQGHARHECECWCLWSGECGQTFTSGASSTENLIALRSHYMDKLGRADHTHLQFMRRHADQLKDACFCAVCGNIFARPVDMLRHLASKSTNKNDVNSAIHTDFFQAVVLPFVGM